jgi:hypothetical protein
MVTLDDFYRWFRGQAQGLPPDTRAAVLEALAQENHRLTYLQLDELMTAGKLPTGWADRLAEFYSRFF